MYRSGGRGIETGRWASISLSATSWEGRVGSMQGGNLFQGGTPIDIPVRGTIDFSECDLALVINQSGVASSLPRNIFKTVLRSAW